MIDYVLHLQAEGYQVVALRGNHEENFIQMHANYHIGIHQKAFYHALVTEKLLELVDNDFQLKPAYEAFFQSLLYYQELDTFFLVHAGFLFSHTGTLINDYDAMLRIRGFRHNPTGKTIIHGHEVTDLTVIQQAVADRKSIIPLDNGCYYAPHVYHLLKGENQSQVGHLCALNLDTFELVVQPNVG